MKESSSAYREFSSVIKALVVEGHLIWQRAEHHNFLGLWQTTIHFSSRAIVCCLCVHTSNWGVFSWEKTHSAGEMYPCDKAVYQSANLMIVSRSLVTLWTARLSILE